MNKEEILKKHLSKWIGGDNGGFDKTMIEAMQAYATQQLAETEAARKEESEGWDRIQKTLEKHLPIEHIVGKDSSKVITEFLEQVLDELKATKSELPSSDVSEDLQE